LPIGRGNDRHGILAARRNDLARRRVVSDSRRPFAVLERKTRQQLAVSGVEHRDFVLVFDVDVHPPRAVGDAKLERAADRNRRKHFGRRRIDDRDVTASRIHDPDCPRRRIVSGRVRLRAGRDRRSNLSSATVEQKSIVGRAIGGNHVMRTWNRKRRMDALPGNDPIGRLSRLEVDRCHPIRTSDIESLIDGIDAEQVPAAIASRQLRDHSILLCRGRRCLRQDHYRKGEKQSAHHSPLVVVRRL
jgi:hypothetical protein